MKEELAKHINVLGHFCGKRDIEFLTKQELIKKYQIEQTDVLVLFGGSILVGGDILAQAMKANISKKYIIVGGVGHTTEALRKKMCLEISCLNTENLSEAELFTLYLKHKYNLKPDLLECYSTNCGNNITYLLELLAKHNITFKNILLIQDATMQYRMEATLRKYVEDNINIINFAAYKANVTVKNNHLVFENEILGMWDMKHYITLLMGEIPRLSDNLDGYGPLGKNFIAHVDIPSKVIVAFSKLKENFSNSIRQANSLYASK